MNEIIAKLYDQAITVEDGGDYVCGELDPVKFAELIVRECLDICDEVQWQYGQYTFTATTVKNRVKEHFGVEE